MMLTLNRQVPAIALLSLLGLSALTAVMFVDSGVAPLPLFAGISALGAVSWWTVKVFTRSARNIAFDFSVLYIALLLFSPPLLQDLSFATRGTKLDQAVLLLGFIWVVAHGLDLFSFVRQDSIVLALIAFWCSSVITGVASILTISEADAGMVAGSIWGQTRPVLVMIVFTSVVALLSARERLRLLHWAFVLGTGTVLVGFAQYNGWQPAVELSTRIYTRKAEQQAVIDAMSAVGRAYGTFDGQPNAFGTFCMIVFCMTLALAATQLVKHRWLALAMTATSASGLAVSWSRGAVAGALVGVLVVLVMVSLKFAVRVGATTVAAIAGLWQVLPEETLRRLQDLLTLTTDNGERIYDARLAFWSSNFDFWTRHPLLGGSGVRLAPADSQYIGLLIGGGIVGIAVFLLVISVVLRRLVQIARNIEHPLRYAALGLTASVVAMLVNGISVPSFMEERVMEFFWFLVALIATPLASERFGEGISSE